MLNREDVSIVILFFVFSLTLTSQLLNMLWSQASFLPPPRQVPLFLSRREFIILNACRLFIEVCYITLSFRLVKFAD